MTHTTFSTTVCFLVFLAGSAAAAEETASQKAAAANYPKVSIREESGSSRVYWDDNLIAELKGNRYLRFRATPRDEKWVGSERKGADLCWAYSDAKGGGMEVLGTAHENHPERGEFALVMRGRKPQLESSIRIRLTGTWMPGAKKFGYSLATSLECPLEGWYRNSTDAQRSFAAHPHGRGWIEAFDYHIEHISAPDRNLSRNPKSPQMYEWFVKSHDGDRWLKSPKIHIPFPIRPGKYITIDDQTNRCEAGGQFGFLDMAQGGWLTRIKKTPSSVGFQLCWYFFDVHVMLHGAIPPRHSTEKLSLEFELAFEPVEADRAREIVARAAELNWRDLEEYKLPLFTRDNRFDKLLTEVRSEDTSKSYFWWASSYDCYRDDTTGFDDHYSVTIKRTKAAAVPAAWSTTLWGYPFETERIKNRRFRLSAMVKTAGCTGPVRLACASAHGGDIFYGTGPAGTYNEDGTIRTDRLVWQFSPAITGTTGWRLLAMEFTARDNVNALILEQAGKGQSWFDNVKIEDLGESP